MCLCRKLFQNITNDIINKYLTEEIYLQWMWTGQN